MIVAVIPTSDEAFQELWVPGGHFNGLDNRVISEYLHKGPPQKMGLEFKFNLTS